MSHKWGEWRDYLTLQERMNRLFEDAARRHGRLDEEQEGELERADWSPASDVYETEDAFVIALDLPGIDRATLDVRVDENRLVVRGERAADEDGLKRRRGNRPAGRFLAKFGPFPPSVDQKKIAAEYRDGVLTLRLPKRAERPPGKVKIEIK